MRILLNIISAPFLIAGWIVDTVFYYVSYLVMFALYIGAIASFFSMLASIVAFNILGAMGFLLLAWILVEVGTVILGHMAYKRSPMRDIF